MSDFTTMPLSDGDDVLIADKYHKSAELFNLHNFDVLFIGCVAALILFLLALIIKVIYDWIDRKYSEEFEYHGVIVSKNHKPGSTSSGFIPIGNMIMPTSSTSPDDWRVFVELDDFGSEVRISVSESYFSKCRKGDKVKVIAKKLWLSKKYDDFQII